MKILLFSGAYFPTINGEVILTHLLATEFVRAGHDVRVVTLEREPDPSRGSYPVVALQGGEATALARGSDVVLVQSIPRGFLLRALASRRPVACIHNVSTMAGYQWGSPLHRLRALLTFYLPQRLLLSMVHGVGVSHFVQRCNPTVRTVIHNPYDAGVFRRNDGPRAADIILPGRVSWAKGTWHLLRALGLLRQRGMVLRATLVGPLGMDRGKLDEWIVEQGVTGQVEYAGPRGAADLAALMNQHRIAVIPSLEEAFGIAAIESLACGCRVAASNCGGLPEALGPHALYHAPEDTEALAANIAALAAMPPPTTTDIAGVDGHLAQFHPGVVAGKYLDLLQQLVATSSRDRR